MFCFYVGNVEKWQRQSENAYRPYKSTYLRGKCKNRFNSYIVILAVV